MAGKAILALGLLRLSLAVKPEVLPNHKEMRMIALRLTTAVVIGCCFCCGCASSGSGVRKEVVSGEGQSQTPDTVEAAQATAAKDVDAPDAGAASPCVGRPVERVEEEWEDGMPRFWQEVAIDEDGSQIPHGLTTQFWPNGQKKLEMMYNCGLREGPRRSWYEDGSLWAVGEFKNGRDHGTWEVWYPDGTKSQEFTMDEGAWHGTHTTWHPNGQKRSEVLWVHGQRQGPARVWDEDGNLVKVDHYVDNVRQPMPVHTPPQETQQAEEQ